MNDAMGDVGTKRLRAVACAMACAGLPAFAWGLWALGSGGPAALYGALLAPMGGIVAASGAVAAMEAWSRPARKAGR